MRLKSGALILEQEGLANSEPNSLGNSPGSLARPPDSTPGLPPAPSSPKTSKVQTAGIFRAFTTSAKTRGGRFESSLGYI